MNSEKLSVDTTEASRPSQCPTDNCLGAGKCLHDCKTGPRASELSPDIESFQGDIVAKDPLQCPSENRCIHANGCLHNCKTGPGPGHISDEILSSPVEEFVAQTTLNNPLAFEELAYSGLQRMV